MMNEPSLPDSSFLDRPEILMYLFYPRRSRPMTETPGTRSSLSFSMEDGTNVDGVMHLAGRSAPNILLFHGNGEVAADYDEIGPLYTRIGINFSVVDYRGYGTSGGSPSYSSMIGDAHQILQQFVDLLEESGLNGPLFLMGRSLGSASALELAMRRPDPIIGLILESGFAHTYQLLINLGVDPRLLDPSKEDMVSNLEKMKKVTQPVLIIHGETDEIIPVSDGLDLYRAARNEVKAILIVPGAGHNTLMLLGLEDYLGAIGSFVERIGTP